MFAHLEHDINTGRPELRLLVDTNGQWDGLIAFPVYLDRPTLGRALADMEAVARATSTGASAADVHSLTGPTTVAALAGLDAYAVWPLILAVTDPANAVHAPGMPGTTSQPATPPRWPVVACEDHPALARRHPRTPTPAHRRQPLGPATVAEMRTAA